MSIVCLKSSDNKINKYDMELYMNLFAAMFSVAKDDWEYNLKKLNNLNKKGYNYNSYLDDEKRLENLRKIKPIDREAIKEIKKRINSYEKPAIIIGEIEVFLKSSYFIAICDSFDLDPEAVKEEFYNIKMKYLQN